MNRLAHAVTLLAGAAAGAALFSLAQVPAGALVGAVIGSALANRIPASTPGRVQPRALAAPVRVVGLVLLGSAAGVRMDGGTLASLVEVAVPLLVSIVLLIVLDLLLAAVLVRHYAIDPLTAVLACAPGGVSEIAPAAAQLGARTGVVLAIHTVRVLVVVIAVLPILVLLLGSG